VFLENGTLVSDVWYIRDAATHGTGVFGIRRGMRVSGECCMCVSGTACVYQVHSCIKCRRCRQMSQIYLRSCWRRRGYDLALIVYDGYATVIPSDSDVPIQSDVPIRVKNRKGVDRVAAELYTRCIIHNTCVITV